MKSYFTFSKSQKIGVVVIIIVIVIQVIVLNKGNALGIPDPFIVDKSEYVIEEGSNYYSEDKTQDDTDKAVNYAYVLQDFDPNTVSIDDWVSFGFSKKQAKAITSYKDKVGGFKTKGDLKKVYVISDQKYAELEPYIKIEGTKNNSVAIYNNESENNEQALTKVELNSASLEDLISIKGIGEYTAKGIIKYKESLGGFHSVNQVKEVYGISDENFELIKPQIEIDKSAVIKLNVNDLSIPELKKHPYISWTIGNAIIDKRLIKKLSGIQFLLDDNYLNKEEYTNLLPYIVYE